MRGNRDGLVLTQDEGKGILLQQRLLFILWCCIFIIIKVLVLIITWTVQ